MRKEVLAGTAIAALAMAAPAYAATFIVTNGGTTTFADSQTTVAGDKLVTFNGATPAGTTISGSNASIVNGSVDGQYAQPFGSDGSNYLSVFSGGTATVATTTGAGYGALSLYLGSIDTYNTIELLSTTGALIASYTGAAFLGGPSGDQTLPATNRLITFTRDVNDAYFGGVRISSSQNSAEVDNIRFSAAVPEPSTWALLLAGFGFIGAGMRRKRSGAAVLPGGASLLRA